MALPLRPESLNAGAGPDEEVAANAGNTNNAARASPFATCPIFSVLAVMMLTPSEEDGRAEQGFEIVGDLGLA
jgi:hypothetical protein